MYNIKPIEVYYNNQHFKSTLEARWACFFDLCGWKWSYEPFKIDKKIPDFILSGHSNKVIIEVKPDVMVDKKFLRSIERNYLDFNGYVLILTDKPFVFSSNNDWFILCNGYDFSINTDYHPIMMKYDNDFSSFTYNWDGVMTKCSDRKGFIQKNIDQGEINRILHNWKTAGITTKFNSY